MKQATKAYLTIIIIALTISLIIVPNSCTDKEGARKTLERNGYKPIEVGGYEFFVGTKSDVYVTKFKAIAPNGETVTGQVTRGLWKGNTIRLND